MVFFLVSLPLSVCMLFTVTILATTATSFKIDAKAASAADGDGNAIDLFAWARQHGAKIAENVEIRATAYGGRGLFAKQDIKANTELIMIPYHLQLGVRQLAEGTDEEMQTIARGLPWEYIRQNELFFIPLSIALVAEKRKGDSSKFHPFLQSLPQYCANAVGPVLDGEENDDLNNLKTWAPNIAMKVHRRRTGIQSLHETLAPPSVSIQELQWAATNVCSRSLVRKRIQELTPDQIKRIGEFSAVDHSRMLPVIDLVNHGSLQHANVWVGHLPRGDGGIDDINDFSTSLKSTRDIAAGEELLFDYGGVGGKKISNDRLLLDYGFVLDGHSDGVSIGLEEFDTAISVLDRDRAGMKDVSKDDLQGLDALITFLIKQATQSQVAGAPLFFSARGGEPSVQTLAVAVAMTCRGQDDVTRVLNPLRQISPQHDASLIPSQIVESCTDLQKEFARFALKRAAGMALGQRPSITDNVSIDKEECDVAGGGESSFANVAREYSIMCRAMLQEVADMSR